MNHNLVNFREEVMDQAERALDAVWPERKGVEYVSQMQSAADRLEEIAVEMQTEGLESVEQSRTYRYLGSIYCDLAPALGGEMLSKSREAYLKAGDLLEGYGDELEIAKFNFNFANTLRQIDPNNIEQLNDAQRRFLAARDVFKVQAPQFLTQVDTSLQSVEKLLMIAPLALAVDRNSKDLAALGKDIKSGGNLSEIAEKMQEVMTRDGGVNGLIGKMRTIIDRLPPELKQSEKYNEIEQKMSDLINLANGGGSMDTQESQIFSLLRARLESELNKGLVNEDRAETLRGILEHLVTIHSNDDNDVQAFLLKFQKLREFTDSQFEMAHYLSHGLERPPSGSRAAQLVELCWFIRRFLLEEMNRSDKGNEVSKEALDLNKRAARVDKRIYEAGNDDVKAILVDKEELRPFALAVRKFSARFQPLLAQPIWPASKVAIETNAGFYSGSSELRSHLTNLCRPIGLDLIVVPKGESYANACWKQIQKAMITIFDLTIKNGPDLASVTYELGIALTLGKPIVIVVSEDQTIPFDIDVVPVIFEKNSESDVNLLSAIEMSVIWVLPHTDLKGINASLDYTLSKYPRPNPDTYMDQTLKLLESQIKEPDPLTVDRTLTKFVEFLKDGKTKVVHPVWSPVYSDEDSFRLFHVMPFRPEWADDATEITRETCEELGVTYIRGDEVPDPNVIQSIWEEIAKATYVVVDLTDFNANVALELGIAHTLGKPTLIVGQGNTVDQLFPMISKLRFQTYRDTVELGKIVQNFINTT